MKYKIAKNILLFWCFFAGIGAMFGGLSMIIDPTGKLLGMAEMLPFFQVLPFAEILFQNFTFAGISLIVVNGISNFIAAFLIVKNKKIGILLGMIFGFTLMLWIVIQFVIFPLNFMSTIFFVFGFLQLICGFACYVSFSQRAYLLNFNANVYSNLSESSKTLVVFFSRKGYTKKIAYEIANANNAEIFEISTPERTKDALGFWWCGRFAMHKWGMPIDECPLDLTSYDAIIIVSPIWVFSVCSPVREFCLHAKDKITTVEYVFTHFNPCSYFTASKELDELLNINAKNVTSVCVPLGKVRYVKKR